MKPYFKPTKATEKGLTTYTKLSTDKRIIFPYDKSGHLISIERMQSDYPGAFAYLSDYYDRLVPKSVSSSGKRETITSIVENNKPFTISLMVCFS